MFHSILAGTLLITPVSASTQPLEQIAIPQIEYLCPLPALANVTLGSTQASLDVVMLENLKSLKKLGPHFAPFTEADLEITPWSRRVAGVSYVAESPDGPTNEKWGAAFEQSLLEAGWLAVSRNESKSPFVAEPRSFEKQMETPLGQRTIFLRFDTPGALVLRCGDLKLFDVQKHERDGVLEPGSLRPVPLAPNINAANATDADCENAALLEAFKEPGIVEETNPVLGALVAGAQDVADRRLYGSRLLTWLKWKLVASGRISEERIWEIQDEAVLQDFDATAAAVTDLLGSVVGMDDAQQQANPKAICTTMLRFMDWQIKSDATDIVYYSKSTQALEKEAQRLGIDID